jgi:predicted membrane-bound spermidine synthase
MVGPLRLAIAFGLMVVPTTAMGATLPILVRAIRPEESRYGRALGRLYGWNTLGAVGGVLAGEMVLTPSLGVVGTGLVAGSLNGIAALAALGLSGRQPRMPLAAAGPRWGALPGKRAGRLLAAAFLSGALLLGLELVWFRFLQLFVQGTSLAFCVMLAVVLLGIGIGGLLATGWLRLAPHPERMLAPLALAAGYLVVQTYVSFGPMMGGHIGRHLTGGLMRELGVVAAWLMAPVCLISGVLFTLLGSALEEEVGGVAGTTGWLTLANTIGATCGALLAGFVLLPRVGMEVSFFLAALGYGLVAWLTLPAGGRSGPRTRIERRVLLVALAVFVTFLGLFPFGLMRNDYLPATARLWSGDGARTVAVREGLNETILYLRKDLWDEALYYRLLTNVYSMSSTRLLARRYMKLFVYWPLALQENPRHALLISYGVGCTAKALTDTGWLQSIDVVDTSKEILELSSVVYPTRVSNPLADPRVRVHVEDGRFFLLESERRYDLITAEPPPPKNSGIVNLYSREYFALVHDRLVEGGIATYWLPVSQLEASETLAIISAFCDQLDDCTLWTGSGPEWMLAGSRGRLPPVSEESFSRQWHDPGIRPELHALGLEQPEQLGSLFIADAPFLKELTASQPPLTDNYPYRLSPRLVRGIDALYPALMDVAQARGRFESSTTIGRLWPAARRHRSAAFFEVQGILNDHIWSGYGLPGHEPGLAELSRVLTRSSLRTPVLWLMGADADRERIAERAAVRGVDDAGLEYTLAVAAMADRDYARAEWLFSKARAAGFQNDLLPHYRLLALCLAGEAERAQASASELGSSLTGNARQAAAWSWLAEAFGLTRPRVPAGS